MAYAIVTKYLGATNTKPSRIVASNADGKRVTVSCDFRFIPSQNHANAAKRLILEKTHAGGGGEWIGTMLDNSSYVWVHLPSSRQAATSFTVERWDMSSIIPIPATQTAA